MKFAKLLVLFLVINFGGLALGGWLMDSGPTTDWYINLNQAPWTPPGWVFGVAWTTIMICFSIYLAVLFNGNWKKSLLQFYVVQVILNVVWNYIFFNQHLVGLGLVSITALALLIFYMFFKYNNASVKFNRLLLAPYMIWICIAISLNAYILINN